MNKFATSSYFISSDHQPPVPYIGITIAFILFIHQYVWNYHISLIFWLIFIHLTGFVRPRCLSYGSLTLLLFGELFLVSWVTPFKWKVGSSLMNLWGLLTGPGGAESDLPSRKRSKKTNPKLDNLPATYPPPAILLELLYVHFPLLSHFPCNYSVWKCFVFPMLSRGHVSPWHLMAT